MTLSEQYWDLTDHERIVLEPDRREVHHPYTDRPTDSIWVTTYSFEEVFAEKTRALAERLRPRDLYDVVHLFRRQDLTPERGKVISTLTAKCEFKGIPVPTLQSIRESPLVAELQVSWGQMLAHQLPVLPSFESFWNELTDVFAWLYEEKPTATLTAVPSFGRDQIDSSWRPPAMATSWRSMGVSAPMEIIRFAAANRLCVSLDYRNEQGRRDVRIIEPYSLRRSSEGNLLLMAVKADTGEVRSYRADRIVSASATGQSFVPRYAIELSDAGPFLAPPLDRDRTVSRLPTRALGKSGTRRGNPLGASGPTHIFRCAVCGKTFKRQSFDATLNPHKNKAGSPCYGTYGTFVKTTY